MLSKKSLLALVVGSCFSFNIFAWNGGSPSQMASNYDYDFTDLPESARMSDEKVPWSSSFWPTVYGGIAFRWNAQGNEEPEFAPLQDRLYEIHEEIAELKIRMAQNVGSRERSQMVNEVIALRTELRQVKSQRARLYNEYFFEGVNRPDSRRKVRRLSQSQINELSPAEKFDIYNGNYNLPLTKQVLRRSSPNDSEWEGICHGWSIAAIDFAEPVTQTVTNPDGIRIEFNSTDLKALLAYYHAALYKNLRGIRQMDKVGLAATCRTSFTEASWFMDDQGREFYRDVENGELVIKPVPSECLGPDAGAFHVVLTNQIGLRNQSFIMDGERYDEIWNHPIVGYESEVLEEKTSGFRPNVSPGTVKQLLVKNDVEITNDGGMYYWGEPEMEDDFYTWWHATNGTEDFMSVVKEYEYYVDLDADGKVIGGNWKSFDRPDFIWRKLPFRARSARNGILDARTGGGILNDFTNLRSLVEAHE